MTDDSQVTPGRALRADAAQRAMRAWNMRVAGESWDSIAVELGYANTSNCIRAVRNYSDSLPVVDREEMRRILRSRAEWLWREMRSDVQARRSGASRAAVALLQRMAVAEGTDAPTRVEVSPTAEAFERAVAAMAATMRGSGPEAVEVDVVEYAEIDPMSDPEDL